MVGLIIVDVQNDFVEGGALGVNGGLAIIPGIVKLMQELGDNALVITTQDWHPANHSQFKDNGGIWPVHCVEGSHGAMLVKELAAALPKDTVRITKGFDADKDGYSGFEGETFIDGFGGLTLEQALKELGVDKVYVCGIATDYCVKATAMDAKKLGLDVHYIQNLSVGVSPETTEAAEVEMAAAGITFHRVG